MVSESPIRRYILQFLGKVCFLCTVLYDDISVVDELFTCSFAYTSTYVMSNGHCLHTTSYIQSSYYKLHILFSNEHALTYHSIPS